MSRDNGPKTCGSARACDDARPASGPAIAAHARYPQPSARMSITSAVVRTVASSPFDAHGAPFWHGTLVTDQPQTTPRMAITPSVAGRCRSFQPEPDAAAIACVRLFAPIPYAAGVPARETPWPAQTRGREAGTRADPAEYGRMR